MTAEQQKKLESGFGAKSEPVPVLAGTDLAGKTAVITGGYSGIGLETTRALAAAGVRVYVPVRDAGKAAETLASVSGDVITEPMDLMDLGSIRDFAGRLAERVSRLDFLINNAGVMACPEGRMADNWELQFGINHLGHFKLTQRLLPLLLDAGNARVVCLSSVAHRRSDIIWGDINFEATTYEKWTAYAQSKTANALFAVELDRRYQKQGLRAFSVHPGGILTPLQRHLPREEMQALGWLDENGELSERAQALFKTPAQGCATTLWAATSPLLDGMGGLYCEDCDVAELADEDTPRHQGVEAYAVDAIGAQRLWDISERLLDR